VTVSDYAHVARRELPPEAFRPARSRLLWLVLHAAIVGASIVAIARLGVRWWTPFLSIAIGCSFGGLAFVAHEMLHGAIVRDRRVRDLLGGIGFLPFVVSPRLWIAWHNRVHHGHTGKAGVDPDAYPTLEAYQGSRAAQTMLDRWRLINVLALLVGFIGQSKQMLVGGRRLAGMSRRDHRLAIVETAVGAAFWIALAIMIGFVPFVFAYLIPLVVGNVLVMSFILTNHSMSPLTEMNDPLVNSLTVTVPRWYEFVTLSFGLHVEHHLFPSMSSRHAGRVRRILQARWPDRYRSMPLGRALRRLLSTARVYGTPTTLTHPPSGRVWPTL
jgi:fatty acid desaturase